MTDQPENARRDHAGRFKPGISGNPAGKPKGTRNRATRAAEALLESEMEAITRKAVDAALSGDVTAIRLCLDRILPARKGRPVYFDMGALESCADLAAAARRVLQAVADGVLSPEEAGAVMPVVEATRKAIETEDLERRLKALEEQHEQAQKAR